MNLLSGFLRLRRSTRAFIRSPGLSLALLLTIALGVGCNAAIYGFLQGLIHPLSPGRNADRLVSIFREDRWGNAGPLTPDEFQRARNNHEVFEWMGAARIGPRSASIAGYSEIATVAAVTPDLAGTLSLPLNRGVVISQRISKTEFSGKESAVGARILVDGAEFRIEGVASNNLDGLYSDEKVDLWIPAEAADIQGNAQYRRDLWVVARLRKDVSVREAQSSLSFRSAGQGEIVVAPFTGLAPKMAGGLLRIGMFLTFAVGGVFFIACSNVASFLLGRALRRSRETSLRIALGATRAELLWDLLSDSLVIALAGGAVGLFLGLLTARALPALLFEGDAERLSFAPRLLPILIAATVCIAITAVCGMLPVAGTMTDRPWMVLQRESGSSSRPILRLRSALVVAQIAICCVLVICTAILLGALHSALQTSAGSRLGDPILLTVQAQPIQGPEIDAGFFDEVAKRAQSVGGLLPLAWTARLPGNQPTWRSFRRQQPFEQSRDLSMDISWLSPGSMQALGIQLIAGRMFGINDQRYRVAVVNEEAAAHLSGKQTAGMVIQDSNKLPIEIIGVVKEGQQVPTNRHVPQLGRRATIYYGFLNQSDPPHTIRDAGFHVPVTQKRPAIELSANVFRRATSELWACRRTRERSSEEVESPEKGASR